MKKRRESPFVQVKMRMREGLWKRLTAVANSEDRTLSGEIVHRLESSFAAEKNQLMIEALLAPGLGLELIRAVGTILRGAGGDWYKTPEKAHAVAEAIGKIVAVASRELRAVEESFPNRSEKGSADHLAWLALGISTLLETGAAPKGLLDHFREGE
jgi:hypothetical protein